MYPRENLRRAMALYAVTDRAWLGERTLSACVEEALAGGATFVQLREKDAPQAEVVLRARALAPLCREAGVPFVVNDDVEAARIAGADGVHVGQDDAACVEAREKLGPDAIVGVSVQTVEQALVAQADGADYLGVGAVFGTPTKPDAADVGTDGLAAICAAVDIPVVAIGGLNERTIPELAGTGADGAAVVSAIFAAEDIEEETRRLRAAVQAALGAKPTRADRKESAMEAVLSIAGSDSSGGAGIQADIKTIAAHRLFAETAITALTAQNTLGVTGVLDVDPAFVAKQIDAVFEDIRPAAVKMGMVSSAAIIEAVADALERHAAANIVVDPVMVATSGARLIGDDAIEALKARLLPLADVVTPNMPEAAVLAGFEVVDEASMERAALRLAEAGTGAALVKGGHRHDRADDVLVTAEGDVVWLRAPRVDTENAHGTGCTLSSAIACGLAKGLPMEEAVRAAKDYVRGALAAGLNLGKGSGPLDHMWEY